MACDVFPPLVELASDVSSHLFVPMHAHAHMQTNTCTAEDHAHSAGVKEKEVEERDTLLEKLQVLCIGCPVFLRACKSGVGPSA